MGFVIYIMGFLIFVLIVSIIAMRIEHTQLSSKYNKKELECRELKVQLNSAVGVANIRIRELNNHVSILLARKSGGADLDQTLVKELIAFCHPDKHQGSDRANRLTQKLLKIRK